MDVISCQKWQYPQLFLGVREKKSTNFLMVAVTTHKAKTIKKSSIKNITLRENLQKYIER